MRSFLFSFLSLAAVASVTAATENDMTRTTHTIEYETFDGRTENMKFTQMMERKLQGNDNNPNACTSDGEYFTCNAPGEISVGDNVTKIDNTIRCLLDSQDTFDFQASPELCDCNARLTGPAPDRVRDCACGVCPKGSIQAVSLDCSVVPDDPFVQGPCTSLNCDGQCNGTGVSVVNQPTPAAPAPAPAEEPSGSVVRSFMVVMVGSLISFISVYWM